MKFKSFGPINGNSADKKTTSTKASPKYQPSVLPKLRDKNASI